MKRYSLDDLLRVTCEEKITVRGKTITIYMRTLGSAADDARQNYAIAAARLAYKLINEERESELPYETFMSNIAELSDSELAQAILTVKRLEFARKARTEINPVDAPEIEKDMGIKDIVEVQEQEDKAEEELTKERLAYIDRMASEYEHEMSTRARDDLITELREMRASLIMEQEFDKAFRNATLYYSCYKNPARTERYFPSADSVGDSAPELRDALMGAYTAMDAFSLDGDALKN